MKTYCPELATLAQNHFGRKKVQPSREQLRAFYRQAQGRLAYPVLWWNDEERQALIRAFEALVKDERLTCYACAVLRNHAHLLIRKHRLSAEDMASGLKGAGRSKLRSTRLAPLDHPVFSADSCHVFKSDPQAVWTCIRYIQGNHSKHRLKPIPCGVVTEYNNWPFHKHNPQG